MIAAAAAAVAAVAVQEEDMDNSLEEDSLAVEDTDKVPAVHG